MQNQEALILQGCGGDLAEWVDGINGILTEEGILKDGFRFEEAYTFKNKDLTCLMFPLADGSKINMGKLAIWRIGTHHTFGGTWLSDYVENRLGGFARDQPAQQSNGKPDCPRVWENGSIYGLRCMASDVLKEHGLAKQAEEMHYRVTECDNRDSSLQIIGEYVNFTVPEDNDEDMNEGMVMG